jgi:tetratricopeptide (TPR) repeat protein/predicted Ser/Thr protein kinase
MNSPSRDALVDAAIADWIEAEEDGRTLNSQEFLACHAEIADELRTFLGDHRGLKRFAARLAPPQFATSARSTPEFPGRQLGDFEIIREIGQGGMGIVYEARQKSLNRSVALKVMNSSPGLDERSVLRFRREAETAATLRHPHIVPIFATGEEAGIHYYAMELIDGPSLDRAIEQLTRDPLVRSANPLTDSAGAVDFRTIARLIAEAAEALHHAHFRGVIHRDIKPSNLLVAADGRLCVSDFGLARIAEQPGLTLSGDLVGSPSYMSPEQAAGHLPLDARTDIYSLGATLYELLTLRPPFTGTRRDEVLLKIVRDEPVSPKRLNARIPPELEIICLKALEKDRRQRYETAADFARDLRNYLAGEALSARRPGSWQRVLRWSRRRPALAALGAVLVVVAALAAYFAGTAWTSREELAAAHLEDAVDDALATTMSGDSQASEQAIAKIAAEGAESGWSSLLRGHLAFHRGEHDEAVRQLQLAIAQLPESVAARALLAAAYVSSGWWEKYEEVLGDLENLSPESAEDYLFRGLAESYLDPLRARQSLDEAIRRRRLPAAFVVRAEVSTNRAVDSGDIHDAEAALADARIACELLPDNPAALLASLNAHLVAAGLYDDAGRADMCDALMEEAERDAEALAPFSHLPLVAYDRAMYLVDAGQEQQAFDLLKIAAERTDNARVAYGFALLLYRRGAFEEGLAVLDRRTHRSHNEEMLRVLLMMELPDGHNRALAACRALGEQYPSGLSALFRPVLLLVLGDQASATAASREFRSEPDRLPRLRRAFYENLLAFNGDELSADKLLAAAGSSKWDQCEAHFFIGLHHLASDDRDAAARHFHEAVASRCSGFLALDWSQAFLIRLEVDSRWPRWVP